MSTPNTPTRTIAVVSAGLSQPSSTRLLADRLADATVRRLTEHGFETKVEVVELRDVARDVTNNLLAGFPSPSLADVIEKVTGADGLIAVTPIFTTSFSGLFKSFFDVIDPTALDGMPIVIGATGGTERHSLALEYAMRPMFTYLHGVVVPTSVYAASADWGSAADTVKSLPDRIERAAGEFASLVAASDRSNLVKDPFDLEGDFSSMIGGFQAE